MHFASILIGLVLFAQIESPPATNPGFVPRGGAAPAAPAEAIDADVPRADNLNLPLSPDRPLDRSRYANEDLPEPSTNDPPLPREPLDGAPSDDALDGARVLDPPRVDLEPKTLIPPPNARPPRSARSGERSQEAIDLVTAALSRPGEALGGRPITLAEALARRTDRAGQVQIVHAYWKVSEAVGQHSFALDQRSRLASLAGDGALGNPALPNAAQAAVLRSALAAADARVQRAHAAVLAAQGELNELFPSVDDQLPLPVDAPHVGSYATRFEELYAFRPAPRGVQNIHQRLPVLRAAMFAEARAATAAAEAVDASQSLVLRGEVSEDLLVVRVERLAEQRRRFLAAVRAYNDAIADYALAVAREGTPATELVTMLIRTRPATTGAGELSRPPIESIDPARFDAPPASRDGFVPRR